MTAASPVRERWRNTDLLVGTGLALAALFLYYLTLAPTVLEADGGEFQFVPWLPGIAHPTGYPLYVLLGWLWTHLLPWGEVAWRMNLLSAWLAAGAVGLAYWTARQLVAATLPATSQPAQVMAAAVAAAVFAVTPTFWSQAVIAEVYALHAVFVTAIIGLTLYNTQTGYDPYSRRARLLTFVCGLSLAHHRTSILLFPAVALFAWWSWYHRPDLSRPVAPHPLSLRLVVTHLLVLITPLLLYLYLPLTAPVTPYASLVLNSSQVLTLYDPSPVGFWRHVTGAVFAGEVQPAELGWGRLLLVGRLLLDQVSWVGVGLTLVGLAALSSRKKELLLLTGLSFTAIVGFNLVYFIGDVFVLFIPAWFLVCLWLGLGSLTLVDWLAVRFVRQKSSPRESQVFKEMADRLSQNAYQWMTISLLIIFLALPVYLLFTRKHMADQSDNFIAQQRWQALLSEPIPRDAILLSNDRNEIMPLWYYQYVEGRRPDLLGLFPLIVPDPAYANIGRLLDQVLTAGRPVYLIKPMAGLDIKADLIPEGNLIQVTRAAETQPAYRRDILLPEISLSLSSGQAITETVKLAGYDLTPAGASPGNVITVTLYWQAVQALSINYTSYVHLMDANDTGVTQNDHRPGGDFYPSSYWQPGEILRDRHTLNLPANLPPGQYRLQAGLYYQPEPGTIRGMGSGVELAKIEVSPTFEVFWK